MILLSTNSFFHCSSCRFDYYFDSVLVIVYHVIVNFMVRYLIINIINDIFYCSVMSGIVKFLIFFFCFWFKICIVIDPLKSIFTRFRIT
ncbi:MAG: hypothetical protein EBZ93_08630 [Actinobacteria bacterium]|nr:hypothetical protein [Actinomycetota bacterium]